MTEYDLSKINKEEATALGLMSEEGKLKLSEDNKELLSQGFMTHEIELKNIGLQNKLVDMPAKLSLYQSNGDELRFKVHPYYKELAKNELLSDQELKYYSENKGTHQHHTKVSGEYIESGVANYKHDPNEKESFYVKLKTENNKEVEMWGVNLKDSLEKANVKNGDDITVRITGKEPVIVDNKHVHRNNFEVTQFDKEQDKRNESFILEYDDKAKSFNVIESGKIDRIKSVNGHPLSEEEKNELKEGNEILINEDTKLKVSPNKSNPLDSNKKLLILSMMLDGGISFILIKSLELLKEQQETKKMKEQIASKEVLESQVQVKELEKKIEENNKNYKQQLEKLSKEVKDVEMKYGSTPELKEIKTFIHKEQTIAETNEQYQRPQNVVNAEDDYQQQEINLDQDKKDEKQNRDLPFEEDLKIDEKQEIKYNDSLDNWEREQIWKEERTFNEKDEEQEQSRGRSR